MVRVFLLVVAAYAALAVVALLAADRLIFQPPRSSYGRETFAWSRIGVGGGDSIAVVHLPNDAARYTILYSHGNAEDVGDAMPILRLLRDAGFGVIAYDYRGYGGSSPGPPTARRALVDADAAWRYAVDALGIPPARLIVYGTSVGSGPAVELAAAHAPGGLILQSAFTSTFRVLTRVRLLPFDRFPNLARLRDVHCPVLVVHGTRDEVVPWSHGKRLFAAAAEPKRRLWVDGAGHNDVLQVAGRRYTEELARFRNIVDRHGESGHASRR